MLKEEGLAVRAGDSDVDPWFIPPMLSTSLPHVRDVLVALKLEREITTVSVLAFQR
jgi:hypothetical protein